MNFRLLVCAVASVVVGASGIANAQSVALPIAPKPNQVTHVIATQEFTITMSSGPSTGPGETELATKSVLGYTQSNALFDGKDRLEAQITFDRLESEQTISGTTKSSSSLAPAVGRSVTAIIDRTGKLVDVRIPSDLEGVSTILKQLIGSTFMSLNVLPAKTMRIGESATVASMVPVRVPGGDEKAPYPTRTLTTLRSIGTIGQDRVAHFDQRIESTEESAMLKLSGAGTIDLNLDGGFIAASTTEWTFTGATPETGRAGAAPTIRATLRVTLTAHE